MPTAIIVHGGAQEIPPEKQEAYAAGCRQALDAGWEVLERGGSALEAVEAAIRVLEADGTFNAGYGAALNADGEVELDAAIMEGREMQSGAVGAVRGIVHPISLARRVLDETTVFLVARGAERFAEEHGIERCPPDALITEEQREAWRKKQKGHDTVGCVVLDQSGTVAAGTSTGGLTGQAPGRIGDSPLVGCGLFATNKLGGCSMTGEGETIIRLALARYAVEQLAEDRHPDEAAEAAIRLLEERVEGEGGCILVDRQGRIGWAHNSPDMACAYRSSEMDGPVVSTRKGQEHR